MPKWNQSSNVSFWKINSFNTAVLIVSVKLSVNINLSQDFSIKSMQNACFAKERNFKAQMVKVLKSGSTFNCLIHNSDWIIFSLIVILYSQVSHIWYRRLAITRR